MANAYFLCMIHVTAFVAASGRLKGQEKQLSGSTN